MQNIFKSSTAMLGLFASLILLISSFNSATYAQTARAACRPSTPISECPCEESGDPRLECYGGGNNGGGGGSVRPPAEWENDNPPVTPPANASNEQELYELRLELDQTYNQIIAISNTQATSADHYDRLIEDYNYYVELYQYLQYRIQELSGY